MRPIRPIALVTAAAALTAVAVALGLMPEQIRIRASDTVVLVTGYFVFAALMAAAHRRLVRPGAPLPVSLLVFELAASIALATAVLGLQASFAYFRSLDAPVALLLTAGWSIGSFAVAVGATTKVLLGSSFAAGVALGVVGSAALALVLYAGTWLNLAT